MKPAAKPLERPQARKLADMQEEYKNTVAGLCCVCEKPVPMWYGRWGDGGSCSRKCEAIQEAKPKYPPSELKGTDDGTCDG